jgi:hypothetical protein
VHGIPPQMFYLFPDAYPPLLQLEAARRFGCSWKPNDEPPAILCTSFTIPRQWNLRMAPRMHSDLNMTCMPGRT